MSAIHTIPSAVSKILYVYLCSYCDYDLEKIKEMYVHEYALHGDRQEYKDILDCIEQIQAERAQPKDLNAAMTELHDTVK